MTPDKTSPDRHGLLAAVDLGSNSFRLLIGRVDDSSMGEQIRPVDSLKQPVRLAGGLQPDGLLDMPSRQRGISALARFGERLRSFGPETVRAVATNTLRVARNANAFMVPAQTALGFPIEVISGREEARLIYLGASHALPSDNLHRLVVDIGGGSTELIVGRNYEPVLFESAPIGCVSLSDHFFPGGRVSADAMAHARLAARDALTPYALAFQQQGWAYAVGTSGTAKSLLQIAEQALGKSELTLEVLEQIASLLIKCGDVWSPRIGGLRSDRRPVLPGGLALMLAVYDEFNVNQMRYCNGALRQGALYDLLGRHAGHDMRRITVAQMADRYGVDKAQASRVRSMAVALFDQLSGERCEETEENRQLLAWAAELAELGLSISHDSYHKHSAYMLSNSDMQGFSRAEQRVLAMLALAQTGGLRKLRGVVENEQGWLMVLCLRIASILHRHRDAESRPLPDLYHEKRRIRIHLPAGFGREHPLTHESLTNEASLWKDVDAFASVVYETS